MPSGAVCTFVLPAQNGPTFEIPHLGTGYTALVDIERSWLPRLSRFQVTRRISYEDPLMPPAERGVPSALNPQSQRQAMCPPQASTARGLFAVKRTRTRVSEDEVASPTSACVSYVTSTIVPPKSVITRCAAGSAAMLVT